MIIRANFLFTPFDSLTSECASSWTGQQKSPRITRFFKSWKKEKLEKKVQYDFDLLLTDETSNVMLGTPNEKDMSVPYKIS